MRTRVGSARVLRAIEAQGVDAVAGSVSAGVSSRPARRIRDGQIGDVTTVVTRAFMNRMNRMVPLATLRRTEQRAALTPMVVSGTHSLDACL